MVESFTYDNHYGSIVNHTKTTETNNPYAYTGRELDTDELYYYRARYYDPSLERFLGEDPIGFTSGDMNFYRYVLNNPVNLTDPRGEFGWIVAGAVIGGFVGGFGSYWNGGDWNGNFWTGFALGAIGGAVTMAGGAVAEVVASPWKVEAIGIVADITVNACNGLVGASGD